MQIASLGNNLHEVSDPIFLEKIRKNITNLLSAESAHNMVSVKFILCLKKFISKNKAPWYI